MTLPDSSHSAFVEASGTSWEMYAYFDQDLATNMTTDEDWEAALRRKLELEPQLMVVQTQSMMKTMRKKWSLKSLLYLL